jgi:hypothetical protein
MRDRLLPNLCAPPRPVAPTSFPSCSSHFNLPFAPTLLHPPEHTRKPRNPSSNPIGYFVSGAEARKNMAAPRSRARGLLRPSFTDSRRTVVRSTKRIVGGLTKNQVSAPEENECCPQKQSNLLGYLMGCVVGANQTTRGGKPSSNLLGYFVALSHRFRSCPRMTRIGRKKKCRLDQVDLGSEPRNNRNTRIGSTRSQVGTSLRDVLACRSKHVRRGPVLLGSIADACGEASLPLSTKRGDRCV